MYTTTTPTTAHLRPSEPTTAQMCTMCNGQGGTWETTDGQSPAKSITRWIKCTGCNGRGTL